MPDYDPDFTRIRPLHGDRRHGFEEFCVQLARRHDAPAGSRFVRIEGAGGDGGVECYWELVGGTKWGYQSKLLDRLDKKQLTNSVETALRIHPTLTRYVICLPFDLSGPTGRRGSNQKAKWESYVAEWQQLASDRGLTVSFELWTESELIDRLIEIDPTGGRLRFWFDQEILGTEWFLPMVLHVVAAHATVALLRALAACPFVTPVLGDPRQIGGFRLVDGRASYGVGLETFAIGFPIHFDWSWRTLFNKDWEDALFAMQGGSAEFRKPRFSVWIGYDF